jgi:hypothetical protein
MVIAEFCLRHCFIGISHRCRLFAFLLYFGDASLSARQPNEYIAATPRISPHRYYNCLVCYAAAHARVTFSRRHWLFTPAIVTNISSAHATTPEDRNTRLPVAWLFTPPPKYSHVSHHANNALIWLTEYAAAAKLLVSPPSPFNRITPRAFATPSSSLE